MGKSWGITDEDQELEHNTALSESRYQIYIDFIYLWLRVGGGGGGGVHITDQMLPPTTL